VIFVAGVAERELGPHQHAAAPQQVGDVIGGAGRAQQHRALRSIDSHAARHRRVPLSAVDGRGAVLRNFENIAVATLGQRAGHGAESGAGQQEAAPGDKERHVDAACYADRQEETR